MAEKAKLHPAKRKKLIFCWICILIPIIGYTIFHLFPIIVSFILQFFEIEYYDLSTLKWNSFASFKEVFSDERLWISLKTTIFLTSAQFVSLAIALITANFLNNKFRGTKFFEVIFFIPHICSMVALAVMWKWMFNPEYGIVNDLLVRFFGEFAKVSWFSSDKAYPWMLFIVIVWFSPGYGIIMYKSVFTTINPAIYEAAEIDGANGWVKFWKITFPELAPMTFYLLMLGIITGMQTFDIAKLFAGAQHQGYAGPHNSGLTLSLFIYKKAFDDYNMSSAAVISWFLFILTFILAMINQKLRKKWVDD